MSANTLNAEFPAEVHVRVDNDWLTRYSTVDKAYMDCRDLDSTNTGRRMRPRGILIGSNSTSTTATTARVKMVLWGENHSQADVYDLALGINHPYSPKFIYANGTTGRNIKILG